MRLTDTEKEILAAIAHLPNNYSLGQFIRRKYQPLMDKLKKENPNWDPKTGADVEKKFRGPAK
jgi:hypothetical protein